MQSLLIKFWLIVPVVFTVFFFLSDELHWEFFNHPPGCPDSPRPVRQHDDHSNKERVHHRGPDVFEHYDRPGPLRDLCLVCPAHNVPPGIYFHIQPQIKRFLTLRQKKNKIKLRHLETHLFKALHPLLCKCAITMGKNVLLLPCLKSERHLLHLALISFILWNFLICPESSCLVSSRCLCTGFPCELLLRGVKVLLTLWARESWD